MIVESKPTILVVADDLADIQVLVGILGLDYRFSTTAGDRAVEVAWVQQPDLILLDVMMPSMSGLGVCKRLKADTVTRAIPVVFLTAQDQEVDAAEGLTLGAIDYITKPFNPAIVRARVKNHTGRSQAEKTIRELHSRNQGILDAAGEGICGLDLDGLITFINPAAAGMLGWEPAELIGKSQHDVCHHTRPDGSPYPRHACPITFGIKTGTTHYMDNEVFWCKNGDSFPVEYSSTPIREGDRIKGAVLIFRDTSSRHQTEKWNEQLLTIQRVTNEIYKISFRDIVLEKQLEESLNEILMIPWFFNQSKGAVFLADELESTLQLVCQKNLAKPLLVKCAEVAFGHCLCGRAAQTRAFIHAPRVDHRHDVSYDGMPDHGHYIVPLVSGERLLGVLTLYLEEGHSGKTNEKNILNVIANSLVSLIDRKRAEEGLRAVNLILENRVRKRTIELEKTVESLREYQDQLIRAERMAALGSMVAGIAHEINTPVGIGFTSATYLSSRTERLLELFQADQLTFEVLEDYLGVALESSSLIVSNLKRAEELVKSFKMVAVDQTSQELRTIDLNGYLHEILLSLRPSLKNTRHSVVIHCPDDLHVQTFPGSISQIVTNLVMNSLVHGFEEMRQGKVEIVASLHGDHVSLVYQDNGKGMDAVAVKRVFEPFFTTKRGQGGSGLGMHVVYNQVTQKLQGTISCESSPGQGVVFTIQFPLRSEQKANAG